MPLVTVVRNAVVADEEGEEGWVSLACMCLVDGWIRWRGNKHCGLIHTRPTNISKPLPHSCFHNSSAMLLSTTTTPTTTTGAAAATTVTPPHPPPAPAAASFAFPFASSASSSLATAAVPDYWGLPNAFYDPNGYAPTRVSIVEEGPRHAHDNDGEGRCDECVCGGGGVFIYDL